MESTDGLTRKQAKQARRERLHKERASYAASGAARRIGIWITVILLFAGSIWALSRYGSSGQPGSVGYVAGVDEITATDHVLGNRDATVTLIEYSDFQCPACASYHPVVKQVMQTYGDRVRFAYRHFPLRQIHANAATAALAAEAAALQGKFWEMHDLLFERQRSWSDDLNVASTFKDYAKELELNADEFDAAMKSSDARDRVATDEAGGARLQISGTPTFYLNGERLTLGANVALFSKAIDDILNAKQ